MEQKAKIQNSIDYIDMERDYYLTADEAKEYGLIDTVLKKK